MHVAGARGGKSAVPLAACAWRIGAVGAAAEDGRPRRAVKFGDRDHDGALHRHEPALVGAPLLQCLELDRVRGDVGNIELRQDFLGALRVVIGRTAHEREAGERHERVDGRLAVLHEIALDGLARVETAGEDRDDVQPAPLEGLDHAVVMKRVPRQHVRAHDEHADRSAGAALRVRKLIDACRRRGS